MVAKMSFTSDEILTTIDGRTDGQTDRFLINVKSWENMGGHPNRWIDT